MADLYFWHIHYKIMSLTPAYQFSFSVLWKNHEIVVGNLFFNKIPKSISIGKSDIYRIDKDD